jgi:hypothetical protein
MQTRKGTSHTALCMPLHCSANPLIHKPVRTSAAAGAAADHEQIMRE